MKYFYFLCFLLSSPALVNAQDINLAYVSHEDIALKNTVLDSNANAMVLEEFGTTSMIYDDVDGRLYVDFVYRAKIKIFNKQGFDHGTIKIPLRISGDSEESVTDIKAFTISFVDGTFKSTELDPKKVFTEKKNKYNAETKFTMPNLMEGSIIQYTYRIKSPFFFNFRTWEFQSDIPKLHSQYVANIPGLYNYNVVLRGPYKLTDQKSELFTSCLRINGRDINCSKMTYIMDNVPAFIEEDYMTAASNFKAAVYFELSDYMLLNGSKSNVTKTWKDVDYELVSDRSFGAQLKRKEAFKDLMPEILKNSTDDLSKAKAVYAYIGKNIKSNGFIGIYSETAVKKALETHSGNTGDINLSLIAALGAAGLDAEAVILSTRSNGAINTLFPVISDFNYVVAKVNIADQSYLLDASVPLLPFGLLPLHCINDKGRVISLKKPSYWYDLKASQKDMTRYHLIATLTPEGKINGELQIYSSGYAGANKRKAIQAANSIDEFVEKLDERTPQFSIKKHTISYLDSLDLPLLESYEIEMNAFENINQPQLFFNPFFIDRTEKNPFNLNERTYPVDLGSQREVRTTMILQLPDNFELADQPKNLSIALPENGGRYLSNTNFADHKISFSQVLQFNKPIYTSDEYFSLKEFFSRIIQIQKTDIILKKSK